MNKEISNEYFMIFMKYLMIFHLMKYHERAPSALWNLKKV